MQSKLDTDKEAKDWISEIAMWRHIAAHIWSSASSFFTFVIFYILFRIALKEPSGWSLAIWGFCIFGTLWVTTFTRPAVFTLPGSQRLDWNDVMSSPHLIFIGGHMGSALVTLRLFFVLFGIEGDLCDTRSLCGVSHVLLAMACIASTGLWLLGFYSDRRYTLSFPAVQRTRYLRFRAVLGSAVRNGLHMAARSAVVSFFVLMSSSWLFLGSVHLTQNIWLCLYSSMFYSLLFVCWEIQCAVHQVIITQHLHLDRRREKYLFHALAAKEQPLVRYLALRELRWMAIQPAAKKQRAALVFSVISGTSSWEKVRSACLPLIDELSKQITTFVGLVEEAKSTGAAAEPVADKRTLGAMHARAEPTWKPLTALHDWLVSALERHLGLVDPLEKQVDVSEKLDEALAGLDLAVLAVQAVSGIVRASYSEDTNGLVQANIPHVINSLISLELAVEKLRDSSAFRTAMKARKAGFAPTESLIKSQLDSLTSCISNGMYQITTTFYEYLGPQNFSFPSKCVPRLRQYLDFAK